MNFLLSTAYFPPIEYFIYLLKTDEIIIEKYENYIKQTYRNRCNIYGPNGKQSLSIPVIKPYGNKTLIKDIRILYLQKWQLIHKRSIETAYNSSPYFLYYKDEIFNLYDEKDEFLFNFNLRLIKTLLKLIGIEKKITFTSAYQKNEKHLIDLRETISPKSKSKIQHPAYNQVFINKYGFISNLSILDLLFNEGPSTLDFLNNYKIRDKVI